MSTYRTAPIASPHMPRGIPYIIGNEAAERFSFYGMKGILVIFMTKYLMDADGHFAGMSEEMAKSYFHRFTSAAYFFPILGALVSDIFLGKFRTIISLSIIYCLGHLALALDDTRLGLFIGLTLIAMGSGGIKPCVSAHVGDQFGKTNHHLLSKVFAWFYFSINLGAFASTLLTPFLLDRIGPNVAFGVPGVLMLLASWVFWLGRREFVHVPPGGLGFVKEALSGDGWRAAANLSVIYVFVAMFWALFDQTGSAWVLQAEHMNRTIPLSWLKPLGWGYLPEEFELLSSQIQAANPLLIMLLIPVFSYVIYPAFNRVVRVTAPRKIAIGFFLTVLSFVVSAWIESRITAGQTPHIAWQLVAYVVLTAAEVMVSITCLDFSYTQAPKKMKSFIMSLYLLSVSLGNLFASEVNSYIANDDGTSKLPGASYYWFFAGAMLVTSCLFLVVMATYREKTYVQDEASAERKPSPPTSQGVAESQ